MRQADESQEETQSDASVDTGGGAHIQGDVWPGRDFVGRDQINVSSDTRHDVTGFENPYLGLRAFRYEDRASYTGRAGSVTAAVARLTEIGMQRTLLFVTGASGSGKSSLAQAGILPALEAHYRHRGWSPAAPVSFRPGRRPLAGLFDALLRAGIGGEGLLSPPEALQTANGFTAFISQHARADQVNLVVIDQFEELFTQADAGERDRFIALMSTLGPFEQVRTHFVATLRSDYLGDLFDHSVLYEIAKEGIDVREMSAVELEDSIQRPLWAKGKTNTLYAAKSWEDGLTKELARQATLQATYLPLLQLTLQEIWRSGNLTLNAYRLMGGNLVSAIRDRATAVVKFVDHDQGLPVHRRPEGESQAMMRLLLDLIQVSVEPGSKADVRRSRSRQDLLSQDDPATDSDRARVLDEMVRARLLSTEQHNGVQQVDLIHESLIANWDMLREAIAVERQALQQRGHFERALAEWLEADRSDQYLLAGIRLAEAGALAERKDISLRGPDARDFLNQSKEHDERRRRELEQALDRAQKQLSVSESQRLAFAARSAGMMPETALLLASEAVEWHHSPLTEEVLRDAFDRVLWYVTPLIGHRGGLYSVAISPNGTTIATGSRDGTARLWSMNAECLAVSVQHKDGIRTVDFSPNGQFLLTASTDGTVQLANLDGQTAMTIRAASSKAAWSLRATFSPDGRHIVACDGDEAWLWRADGSAIRVNWDAREKLSADREVWMRNPSKHDPDDRAAQQGHTDRIFQATFDSDGKRIVTASGDRTARIWSLEGDQLAILRGHERMVISAIFSPDGQFVLTGSTDKTARLWRSDGKEVVTLHGHQADVANLAFSPEGNLFVTASNGGGTHDPVARLWTLNGELLATLEGEGDWTRCIAFSPSGRELVAGYGDGAVRIWNIEGEPKALLHGHQGVVTDVTFSGDSRTIFSASLDGTARIWRLGTSLLPSIPRRDNGAMSGAIYDGGGTRIIGSMAKGATWMWDLDGRHLAAYGGEADLLSGLSLSGGKRHLLTIEHDGRSVRRSMLGRDGDDIGNASLNTADLMPPLPAGAGVKSAVINQEGDLVVIRTDQEIAYLWRVEEGVVHPLDGSDLPGLHEMAHHSVDYILFNPDNRTLITASVNGMVWLWTLDGKLVTSFLVENYTIDNLFAVASSPTEELILATVRNHADLWSYGGDHLARLPCSTNKVKRGLFSPDGTRILTMGESAFPDVRLWAGDGRLVAKLACEAHEYGPVAFDRRGNRLCISDQHGVRVWDRDGTLLAALPVPRTASVNTVLFSHDGKRVLGACTDQVARLWVIDSEPRLQTTFRGHSDRVVSAAFSPDEQRVLTASADGMRQFVTDIKTVLDATARRVRRRLSDDEITQYHVPTPLRFNPTR